MRVETLRRCLLLQALSGCSDAILRRLLLHYGTVDGVWQSDLAQWPALEVPPPVTAAFGRMRETGRIPDTRIDIERQLGELTDFPVQVYCLGSADYPPLLKTIADPPPLLYVRGAADYLLRPQLAVVGSRRASSSGLRAAREFSAAAVELGMVVTSGLALGIDGAAHAGALAAGGASVAVMATGIEQIYPRRHRQLGEQLSQAGCLVTEYPPGSQPLREHFPRRNRIISGLSLGVLVVEAALPSGSLITAGTALEQGREVFTLPWSIYHPGGRGCLRLLRDGATQVQEVDDIVQQLASLVQLQRALSLPEPPAEERQQRPARKDRQSQAPDQVLLTLIGDATIGVDELAAHSRLPPSQVMALLSSLELEGQVERSAGGYSRSTGS